MALGDLAASLKALLTSGGPPAELATGLAGLMSQNLALRLRLYGKHQPCASVRQQCEAICVVACVARLPDF